MNTQAATQAKPRQEPSAAQPRRRTDPILQELWDTRAALNAQANYDVNRLIEITHQTAAQYVNAQGRVQCPVR